MSGMSPVISLNRVTYGYPPAGLAEPALIDVTLDVPPLDFLGVIGPNGGGKTTLLKVILGLVRPQRGEVRVLGAAPKQTRHRIGYVPQHAQVDVTAPANVLDVALTGRLRLSPWGPWFGKQNRQQALAALAQVACDDLARRGLGELSGGQRQRVLIARALAADAELLILDEPTAGVDPHAERGLIDLLHELNSRMPIIVVSHDVSFVSRHLKRVACLNRRCVVHEANEITDDNVAHLYHHPVMAVHHEDNCALADPGCDAGCAEHGHGS